MNNITHILEDSYYAIKLVTYDKQIEDWLYKNKITYYFNDSFYKSDADWYGRNLKCCFCLKKSKWAFYNGYHNHVCNTKHYFSTRYFTTIMCNHCFITSKNKTLEAIAILMEIIEFYKNILNSDIITIILPQFIKITKTYKQLYFGFLDC
jgi:hypothetical protein